MRAWALQNCNCMCQKTSNFKMQNMKIWKQSAVNEDKRNCRNAIWKKFCRFRFEVFRFLGGQLKFSFGLVWIISWICFISYNFYNHFIENFRARKPKTIFIIHFSHWNRLMRLHLPLIFTCNNIYTTIWSTILQLSRDIRSRWWISLSFKQFQVNFLA